MFEDYTMKTYKVWLFVTSSINIVTCQLPPGMTPIPPVPDKCQMHEAMFKQCCVFPPFFTRDVARECGAKLTVDESHDALKLITVRRQMFNKCNFWKCVLNKYDLHESPDIVDDKKYYTHLDRWVNLNPNFADVVAKAKVHCKMNFRDLLPLKTCEFFAFQQCIRHFVNLNCPAQALIETETCEELKKFYDECRQYYL